MERSQRPSSSSSGTVSERQRHYLDSAWSPSKPNWTPNVRVEGLAARGSVDRPVPFDRVMAPAASGRGASDDRPGKPTRGSSSRHSVVWPT